MTDNPLESAIVKAIQKACTQRGAWQMKHAGTPGGATGVPDLIVCYRGRFVALEVKRPTTRNTVTKRQAAQLAAINNAGGYACVVTTVAEAVNILGMIDRMVTSTADAIARHITTDPA